MSEVGNFLTNGKDRWVSNIGIDILEIFGIRTGMLMLKTIILPTKTMIEYVNGLGRLLDKVN